MKNLLNISENSVFIDIHNDPNLLRLIIDSIPYMKGWQLYSNVYFDNENWAKYPNKTPRYFDFYLKTQYFMWAVEDEKMSNPEYINLKVTPIRDDIHLSHLLEAINQYTLRYPTTDDDPYSNPFNY